MLSSALIHTLVHGVDYEVITTVSVYSGEDIIYKLPKGTKFSSDQLNGEWVLYEDTQKEVSGWIAKAGLRIVPLVNAHSSKLTNQPKSKAYWNKTLYTGMRIVSVKDKYIDFNAIKTALENGADPNYIKWSQSSDKKSFTVLGWFVVVRGSVRGMFKDDASIEKMSLDAIALLFKYGAKLQRLDSTILYQPITRGDYDLIKLLLENGVSSTTWDFKDAGNVTPAELALSDKQDKILELLIMHGAAPPSPREAAQLRFTSIFPYDTDLNEAEQLLKNGANINDQSKDGHLALINASSAHYIDDLDAVMWLLDRGADVNGQGKWGLFEDTYPLHVGIYITSFTLQKPDSQSDKSKTAKLLLKLLMDAGALVATVDKNGDTPLHIASRSKNTYAVKMLLDAGTKVMPRNKKNKTPLDYAESSEIIKLLKSHGAVEY